MHVFGTVYLAFTPGKYDLKTQATIRHGIDRNDICVQILAMVLLVHVGKLASNPALEVRDVADEVGHYFARLPPAA
jgi:hypothetical protein